MKYVELQKKVVEEEGWITNKQLRFLVLRIIAFVVTLFMVISLLVSATIGTTWAILLAFLFIFIFITMIDITTDSEKSLKTVAKISHLWLLNLALFVGLFILLRYFNFV